MRHVVRTFAVAAAVTIASWSTAAAQEYTWTSAVTMKLGSMPGVIAKLLGSGKEVTELSSLSGNRLRTDNGPAASIIDVDGGRFITLNAKNKTYTVLTFEEMAAMADAARAEAQKEQKKNPQAEDVKVKFDVAVKRTGEHATIAGVDAQRSLIILSARAEATEQPKEGPASSGTLAFVVDTWNAASAPHAAAMKAFQAAYAKRMSRELGGSMTALQAAFSQYEGMEEGWESALKEMKKVEGVPVKSVTYIVTVPVGMKLDTEEVLNPKEQPKESAGSKIAGGLMGRLKAAAAKPAETEEPQAQAPKQATLLSVTSEVREIHQGGVAAGAFDIPAGYKEQKPKR